MYLKKIVLVPEITLFCVVKITVCDIMFSKTYFIFITISPNLLYKVYSEHMGQIDELLYHISSIGGSR